MTHHVIDGYVDDRGRMRLEVVTGAGSTIEVQASAAMVRGIRMTAPEAGAALGPADRARIMKGRIEDGERNDRALVEIFGLVTGKAPPHAGPAWMLADEIKRHLNAPAMAPADPRESDAELCLAELYARLDLKPALDKTEPMWVHRAYESILKQRASHVMPLALGDEAIKGLVDLFERVTGSTDGLDVLSPTEMCTRILGHSQDAEQRAAAVARRQRRAAQPPPAAPLEVDRFLGETENGKNRPVPAEAKEIPWDTAKTQDAEPEAVATATARREAERATEGLPGLDGPVQASKAMAATIAKPRTLQERAADLLDEIARDGMRPGGANSLIVETMANRLREVANAPIVSIAAVPTVPDASHVWALFAMMWRGLSGVDPADDVSIRHEEGPGSRACRHCHMERPYPEGYSAFVCPALVLARASLFHRGEVVALRLSLIEACDVLESAAQVISEDAVGVDKEEIREERARIKDLRRVLPEWLRSPKKAAALLDKALGKGLDSLGDTLGVDRLERWADPKTSPPEGTPEPDGPYRERIRRAARL